MGLIKCPECGHLISEFADKCISCGLPMEKLKDLIEYRKTNFPIRKNGFISNLEDEEKEYVMQLIANVFGYYIINESRKYLLFIPFDENSHIPFWISRPKAGLSYSYKSKDGRKHKHLLKKISLNSFIEICNDTSILEKVSDTPKSYNVFEKQTPSIAEILSKEEIDFISILRKSVTKMFPAKFTIENNLHSRELKFNKQPSIRFAFTKSKDTLLFRYPTINDGEIKEIAVTSLDSEAIDALIKIIIANCGSSLFGKELFAEEHYKRLFLERINPEIFEFIKKVKAEINDRYPSTYDFIDDYKYYRIRKKTDHSLILTFKKRGKRLLAKTKKTSFKEIDDFSSENIQRLMDYIFDE